MFEFDAIQSILILSGLMFAGEFLAKRLKGMLPAVLVSALALMALVWGGLIPESIVESTGFTGLTSFVFMIVIMDMGASTNFHELWANRNVVILAAAALVFQIVTLLLVIGAAFGLNTSIAGLPGGSSVMMIVQERARQLGYDRFVTQSVVLMSTQSLIGAPLVALFVRREVKRLRVNPRELAAVRKSEARSEEEKGDSVYLAFFKLTAGAWIATRLERYTGFSRYAYCLIVGVVLKELGFLKKNELDATNSRGLVFFIMMTAILSGFCGTDAKLMLSVLAPVGCILACDVAAICLFSPVLGRRLGFSREMSMAIGMQIMIGFPLNMMISQDIVSLASGDEEEREKLMASVGTRLVIAGITSLTMLSVIFASLLVPFMK